MIKMFEKSVLMGLLFSLAITVMVPSLVSLVQTKDHQIVTGVTLVDRTSEDVTVIEANLWDKIKKCGIWLWECVKCGVKYDPNSGRCKRCNEGPRI